MGKPIILTQQLMEEMIQEFAESLKKAKLFDGKLTYTKQFKYKEANKDIAIVRFTPSAYVKMMSLVYYYTTEVAWRGIVHRDEKNPCMFIISDILVFPQTVAGSTVTTDEMRDADWMDKLSDDQFNHMRMHGHSHVNMGTSPSGTDTDFQNKMLVSLPKDDFYIFLIWNKRNEHTARIFDVANNIMYENTEILIEIGDETFTDGGFIIDSKKVVETQKYTPPTTQQTNAFNRYNTYNTPSDFNNTPVTTPAKNPTTPVKNSPAAKKTPTTLQGNLKPKDNKKQSQHVMFDEDDYRYPYYYGRDY